MTAGEIRRLWIPAVLAYGERPPPGAPAGQLCFDVQLYSFVSAPKPPAVPSDVAGIPANAEVTSSGLASRVLKVGSGGAKPKASDRVTVNYSGWTTDGKMFDSSIPAGDSVTFPLNRVIAGWTEGLQLMSVGESRRFWIPAPLAYGDNPRPGAPKGMLVFDVDLLKIN
jgi:peptidylprolyl isomerase